MLRWRVSLGRSRIGALVVVAAVLSACVANDRAVPQSSDAYETASAHQVPDDVALPIVFVHGIGGSGMQYESQSQRFGMNGYPLDRITAFESDASPYGALPDVATFVSGLRETIDSTLAKFDAPRLYLVGHSRGASIIDQLLDDPVYRAKVAKYVSLDGAPCRSDSGFPACLAITIDMLPAGSGHIEVATSVHSFSAQYEFLVGAKPTWQDITAQADPVTISGRAVSYPTNTPLAGSALEIWNVDPLTGHRTGAAPEAEVVLDSSGDFGPIALAVGAHYEYALSSTDSLTTQHVYLQPHLRDSQLVRLLVDDANDSPSSSDQSSILVVRMREWNAFADDTRTALPDTLHVSTGDGTVDVLGPHVGNGAALLLDLHDDANTPGVTTLDSLPAGPYRSGTDVYLPASPDGSGTITITSHPRGDSDHPQVVNVPNWPSDHHATTVIFADYSQTID